MAGVAIGCNLEALECKVCHSFHFFPHLFAMICHLFTSYHKCRLPEAIDTSPSNFDSSFYSLSLAFQKMYSAYGEAEIANILSIIKKAREFQKNIYFCFIDNAKAFDCVDHNKIWKILKEMGIPDHLTCLLKNLYAGQEAAGRTGHRTSDWFQIGKGVHQGCILSPCLFNLYAEYIMRNAGL